jgi:hypothetical protein
MKKFRPYLITLGAVAIWGVFAYVYLGVEDGSSCLSPLGWLHVCFLLPGLFLFHMFKNSHSNVDIPIITAISWVVLTSFALAIVHTTVFIKKRIKRKSNIGVQDTLASSRS